MSAELWGVGWDPLVQPAAERGEGVVKGQWTVSSGLTLPALGLVCVSSSAQGRFCAGGWDMVVLSARTLDVA